MNQRGFTLIEMIVAVVILGIITGAAAFSFRSSIQAASAKDAIEQVKALDSSARQRARRFNQPVEIFFDLADASLARREGGRRAEESFRASLPRGFSIDQVNIAGQSIFNGEASVTISPQGYAPSYALHLIGPQFDQWLLFAGLSGQMTIIKDEATIQDILATSRPRRNAD
jgi:prepilin-type N-terminal cleavage/methylation domain-containing protein